MNRLKKTAILFAGCIAFAAAMPAIPASADATWMGSCGEKVSWVYPEETKTLEISGTGSMSDFSIFNQPAPWSSQNLDLRTVKIAEGVTSIGQDAFYNCSELTNITIPDSVTSIGQSAFYNCTGLTGITIPDSVTHIGQDAFSHCTSLTDVVIPDSVTDIGTDTFYECSGLTSVTIGSSVTNIGETAFYRCIGLKSVTIPGSVTSIGDRAFNACSGLTDITIPGTVTSIGDAALSGCDNLTVRGYAGSAAEAFAKENSIPFQALTPLSGDFNTDGKISADDAQLTLRAYTEHVAGLKSTLTPAQKQAADINGDGEIGVEDAQLILRYYTEKTVADKDITWEDLLKQ